MRKIEEAITPDIQQIGDALVGVKLVNARTVLEPMFGKNKVDFSFSPYAHVTVETRTGKIIIINKQYVDIDEDVLIIGDMAIGYL